MIVVTRKPTKLITKPTKLITKNLIFTYMVSCMLVLLLGWGMSNFLTGDLPSSDSATLVVIDPPAEFETLVRQMGFTLEKRDQLTDLKMDVATVRGPKGLSEKEAYELLSKRFPELTVSSDSLDVDPAIGAGLFP